MEKTDSSPLSRQALYADKNNGINSFLFLLAVGVGFTVAGIIFFLPTTGMNYLNLQS